VSRLRFWAVSLALAAGVGLLVVAAVATFAEPLAEYLTRSIGGAAARPILGSSLVATLGWYTGMAAFLGCLGIAAETARPRRRTSW
jgi:hypothetical protein